MIGALLILVAANLCPNLLFELHGFHSTLQVRSFLHANTTSSWWDKLSELGLVPLEIAVSRVVCVEFVAENL